MTTTATRPPGKPARQWTKLEAPQVALLLVALVFTDVVVAAAMLVVIGDAGCRGLSCRLDGVSVTRPIVALVLAALTTVVPVGLAWRRRRGMRTVLAVQVVAGALLVTWAVSAVTAAQEVRVSPPAVPVTPSARPCAAITLSGLTCLTYAPPSPVADATPTATPATTP